MTIGLGIESTAHTLGIGIVKDGKIIANEKDSYSTKQGGIIPMQAAKHHEKAFNMGNKILKVSTAERDRGAKQWMTGGGRDPKGRSLEQEIKLGKDRWIKNQKPTNPVKSKVMPVTTYIDKMNVAYSGQEKRSYR